jgi:hypothetical protein
MATLTHDQLIDRLIESLRVIEINIQLYNAGEIVAWIPIANELYKLLLDDRYGALIPELFPQLKLHPVRHRPSLCEERNLLFSPGVTMEKGRVTFNLFKLDATRIELADWLRQDIVEENGICPTIADFVTMMRHNISAHLSRKALGGKTRVIERFAVISEAGIKRPAFTRILIDLAIYLLNELNGEMGRQAGPSLSLLEQTSLMGIVQDHNVAKSLMDEIVAGKLALTERVIIPACEKMESSARSLTPVELRVPALLILTHMGEAYRFLYLATKKKLFLIRAISALESARTLLDESSSSHHRALVFFNLGQIYNIATVLLGYITCWKISIEYFEAVIDITSKDEDPELFRDAIYHAGWQAFKLLRFKTAIMHYRTYRAAVVANLT